MRTAVVTCYYNNLYGTKFGGREGRNEHYKRSFESLLKMTDADFFVFCEPSSLNELKEIVEKHPENNIKLIEYDLNNFYMQDLFEKYKDYNFALTSTRCQELQYTKSLWMKMIVEDDDSYDYYFWIDMGLSYSGLIPNKHLIGYSDERPEYYNSDLFNNQMLSGLIKFTGDKVFIINIANAEDYFYNNYIEGVDYGTDDKSYHTIGGMFGGKKDNVLWFHETFEKTAREVITTKQNTYDEEMIFNVVFKRNEGKFASMEFDLWLHDDNEGSHRPGEDKIESWSRARRFYQIFIHLMGL